MHWVRVVPVELREAVLRECHDFPTAGHFGVKTFERVKSLYLWPSMKSDVVKFVA